MFLVVVVQVSAAAAANHSPAVEQLFVIRATTLQHEAVCLTQSTC